MMMIKSSVILVTCILLFSTLAVQASQNSFGPDECCFKFYSKVLPKRRLVSYKYTDRLCPMQGVLFTMKNGFLFCVDPSVEWVKKIITAEEKVHGANASSSGSHTTVSN